MSVLQAKVKSVISGGMVVLTPPQKPDQERELALAYVSAPRMTEPYGFESREYLRTLLVGKPVKFKILYEANGRQFGDLMVDTKFDSLIEKSLADGNCNLRDDASNKNGYEELGERLETAQETAKSKKLGVWSGSHTLIDVQTIAPEETGDKQFEAIVERVIGGDRMQIRALLNKHNHFFGQVLMAGIRTPRSASNETPAEPMGDVAKQFVTTRLLQRPVSVKFLARSSSGVPIVSIIHPAGDIAQLLLANGLATVADWQSQFLGAAKMGALRAAERQAKEAKLNLWKGTTTSNSSVNQKTYEATIAKVISTDTFVVRTATEEETVQLASVRAPRKNDPQQGPWVNQAKEFARSRYIAKKVLVTVEAIRPKSEQFEERPLVTMKLGDENIGLTLVQNGWATVVRHRKDDDDRSPNWDEMMEREGHAIAKNKGMHSKKTPPKDRVVEASENVTKARGFLTSLERQAKLNAIVEHASSGGRLRCHIPKENCNISLVLSGVRVPKPNEPAGDVALDTVQQRVYQRDVHITVQNVDKTGAFIGHVYLPGKNVPLSLALVKEGLAQVHEISAQHSGMEQDLYDAEEEARAAKRGLWKYEPQVEQAAAPQATQATAPAAGSTAAGERRYRDAVVTHVSPEDAKISYRYKDSEGTFTKLINDLASFNNAGANSTQFNFSGPPRKNEMITLISNGKFARAKIIGIEKPKYIVHNLDTGEVGTTTQQNMRPLPKQFQAQAPLAHTAVLSFVETPPQSYVPEYVEFLEKELYNTKLALNVDNAGPPPSITIYTANSKGSNDSVNTLVVDEGYAFVKPKLDVWEKDSSWKDMLDALKDMEQGARDDRVGVWEYGDPRNID